MPQINFKNCNLYAKHIISITFKNILLLNFSKKKQVSLLQIAALCLYNILRENLFFFIKDMLHKQI